MFALFLLVLPARAQDSIADELAAKAREAAPAGTTETIDWDRALASREQSRMRGSGRFRALTEAADAIPLPVLLPAQSASVLATAQLTSGEGWYAALLKGDALSMSVHGTANARVLPELAAKLGTPGSGYRTSFTDGVTTLSFTRFGVAYDIEIECEAGARVLPTRMPTTHRPAPLDPLVGSSACFTDADAEALVASLEVLGGQP